LLDHALSFLSEIQSELVPTGENWQNNPEGREKYRKFLPIDQRDEEFETWIWKHKDCKYAINSGETPSSGNYWFIDPDGLARTCNDYLKQPWIHCGAIDRIFLSAMIYQKTLDFGDDVKPLLIKEIGGGVLAQGENRALPGFKDEIKPALWRLLAIFFAISVGLGVASQFNHYGAAVLAGFIFWFLYLINSNFKKSWNLRHAEKMDQRLHEMLNISDMMNEYPLSPRYLRERLSKAADIGVVWPAGIFPILDNAITRNSLTWDKNVASSLVHQLE
jgi:hypothetical protein